MRCGNLKSHRYFLSALLAIGLLSGCGGAEYTLVSVSGIVTLDDKPLVGATVVFQPKTGQAGKTAPGSVGKTDESGRYELTTVNGEPGAAPGMHKVRIYSYSPESAPANDWDTEPNQERVPMRYNYKSKLMFEVVDAGTEKADFQLTTEGE